MKTYGLEQEFFVTNKDGQLVLASSIGLPHDDNHIQAEARGLHDADPTKAVFNLMYEVKRMSRIAASHGAKLLDTPVLEVPKELKNQAARTITKKGPREYQNLYGHETHLNEDNEMTAGIHVSFVEAKEIKYNITSLSPKASPNPNPKDIQELLASLLNQQQSVTTKEEVIKYSPIWDFPQVFRKLDKEFKDEIANARRNPGFYEIKYDGRIEYRSLPNNIDLLKLADILNSIK